MELAVITWRRGVKVWWAYMWRTMLITGAIGFFMVLVIRALGVDSPSLQSGIVTITTFVASVIPMMLILGKDFGEFRLILAKSEPNAEGANEAKQP